MKEKAGIVLKKISQFFLPFGILILVAFLTKKTLFPKILKTAQFRAKLRENEADVLVLEKKAKFLEEQKSLGLSKDFERVKLVLPDEKDVAALLISLENLRQNVGVKLETLNLRPGLLASAGAVLKENEPKEFGLRMSLSSSFESLVNFLEKLEATAPLTTVEELSLNFISGKDSLKTDLSLRAYYLPSSQEPLLAKKPLPEISSDLRKTLEEVLGFETLNLKTSLPKEKIGKDNPFSY